MISSIIVLHEQLILVSCISTSPVQARFILQYVWMDQLFKQTVHQDGQRSEADVVQCQINTVIQSLGWAHKTLHLTPAH